MAQYWDDVISKQLNNKTDVSLFEGLQNGFIFEYNSEKKFAYINCILNEKRQSKYQITIIDLDLKSDKNMIEYFPINIINNEDQFITPSKNKKTIYFQRCPQQQKIFILHVKQQQRDEIYIGFFDLNDMNQKQKLFYRMNLKQNDISKILWDPISKAKLYILYKKAQQIQIYDIINSPMQCSQKIALDYIKTSCNIKKESIFTDMNFFPKNLHHMFSLFLQTNKGQIYELFPIILNNTQISEEDYKYVKSNKSGRLHQIYKIINNGQINQFNNMIKIQFQDNFSPIKKLFFFKQFHQSFKIYGTINRFYTYSVYKKTLILQTGYNNQSHYMKLSILPQNESNIYYQIIDINNKSQNSDPLIASNLYGNYLYVYNKFIYELNLEHILNSIKQNKFAELSTLKNPITFDLLVQIPNQESIICHKINEQGACFIRKYQKKSKFEFINFYAFESTKQLKYIGQKFSSIIKSIQATRNNRIFQKKDSAVEQQNQLDEKTVSKLSVVVQQYCQKSKNKIDDKMKNLEKIYKKVKQSVNNFEKTIQSSKRLEQLLKIVQQNDKKIKGIFYNSDSSKQQRKSSICQIKQRIQALSKTIQSINKNKIKHEFNSRYLDQAKTILQKVKKIRQQTQTISKQ